MMDQVLHGKHAVVTGGGRGIGAAVAERLAAEGVRLTLIGRDPVRLAEAAAALPEAVAAPADVSDEAAVDRAFDSAREAFGPVDILVNNAGIARTAPLVKMSLAMWEESQGVNVTGSFLCARAALPDMFESGWGRIVNVASIAGLRGLAYGTAYCASKHGMIGFTRALAMEAAPRGVTVNAVCPGYVDTDLVADAVESVVAKTGRTPEQVRAHLVSTNPQGRMVTPDEVASSVLWLCLPESGSINGAALPIAGGEVG